MRIAAAKLARKLHKKGAAGDRPPSNFRDKTNVSVEASVRRFLTNNFILLII